jgi:hypothetical protein
MGPPAQIQQQAQVIAVVLHALKEQILKAPNADPQSQAKDVAAVEGLESGMNAVATARDQDGFDFALIRMCTDDRVATAQQLGPTFVQASTQYLAQHPEMADQNPEPELVTRAKILGAVGNIIAKIPTWCAQYEANVQTVYAQDAQVRQAQQAQTNQAVLTLFAGYLGYIATPRYEGVGSALNNAYNAARSVQ